jgi:hypothetical protein
VQTLKTKIVARNKKQHKKPVKMPHRPVVSFPLPRVRDSHTRESRMVAAPFLKWAGGKRQLLSHIEALVPERIDTYFEPFLGGAAVFFWLAARGRFRRAVLADATRSWSTATRRFATTSTAWSPSCASTATIARCITACAAAIRPSCRPRRGRRASSTSIAAATTASTG